MLKFYGEVRNTDKVRRLLSASRERESAMMTHVNYYWWSKYWAEITNYQSLPSPIFPFIQHNDKPHLLSFATATVMKSQLSMNIHYIIIV